MDTLKKALYIVLGIIMVVLFFTFFAYFLIFLLIGVVIYTIYRIIKDKRTEIKVKQTKNKKVKSVIIEAEYKEK